MIHGRCTAHRRKLGTSELDNHRNLILPQNPRDRSFDANIQSISKLFGDHRSLFNTRYRCLKLGMNESDDFLTHAAIVNRVNVPGSDP